MILKVAWAIAFIHIIFTWGLAIYSGKRAHDKKAKTPDKILSQPWVSILVPAWRDRGVLERCIYALKKIDYQNWESIILAGGPDDTYECAVQAIKGDTHFRVLERGPEPKNVALSRGVGVARSDILVFLDADCVVAVDWLSKLVVPLLNGYKVSFGNRFPLKETWVSLAEQMVNIQAYDLQGSRQIQGDRSIAVRRDALERIGGLPAHAFGREDWDIGMKWMDSLERVAFADEAVLHTERPFTIFGYWHNEIRWRKTHLQGLWEHRAIFIRHPEWTIQQLYFYLLSIGVGLVIIVGLINNIFSCPFGPFLNQVFFIILFWLCGRRVALGVEIAVFTGNPVWFWRAWGLIILMLIDIPASLWAMMMIKQGTPFDYKGSRTVINE